MLVVAVWFHLFLTIHAPPTIRATLYDSGPGSIGHRDVTTIAIALFSLAELLFWGRYEVRSTISGLTVTTYGVVVRVLVPELQS